MGSVGIASPFLTSALDGDVVSFTSRPPYLCRRELHGVEFIGESQARNGSVGKSHIEYSSEGENHMEYSSVGDRHMEYSSIEKGWLECVYLGNCLMCISIEKGLV
jgi:hypothetical protein